MGVDLHTHSTASDGTVEPAELAREAKAAGLLALALTDHDTTAGVDECGEVCSDLGVTFVPGIEVSCERGRERGTLHILGYFVDGDDAGMVAMCEKQGKARADRVPLMLDGLRDAGVEIDEADVTNEAGEAAVGRPHVATVMMRHGYVGSVDEAFARYLGPGGAGFVRKDVVTAEEAIGVIHGAGGIAVLAHAVQLRCRDDDDLNETVERLKGWGLDGIEAIHPDHDGEWVDRVMGLAARLGLITTGGSDYHGSRKPQRLGSMNVDDEVYQRLSTAREKRG